MQKRKDEILAKKAKLADLKRRNELRVQESAQRAQTPESPLQLVASIPTRSDNRKELDTLISSLVGESRSTSTTPRDAGNPPSPHRTTRAGSVLPAGQLSADLIGHASTSLLPQPTLIGNQTLSTVPVTINYEFTPAPTHEVLSYSKGIQTTEPWSPQRSNRSLDGFSDSDNDQSLKVPRTPKASKRLSRREREKEEDLRQNLRREIEEELKAARDLTLDGPALQTTQKKFPARALSEDELNAVTSSDDFLDFVERSSKVIERALDEEYDVLANYATDGRNEVDEDDDEGFGNSRGKKGRRIREVVQFYDERWSKKRMISDLDFSPKFPELLLASYTKNGTAPQDPSGLVQIWNLHLHSRPEYIFHSTSDIVTAKFSPHHPSLVIGGSYSGQVLIWDTRSKSPLPVQKTPLTGSSTGIHTHPIYSLSITGSQNAHNIISCSTDGTLCTWTVDMLTQPQEHLNLAPPAPSKPEDLSPTCMAFPAEDPTSFLVGTEEGIIYPCHRYERAGAKAGVDSCLRYKSHSAPVMSLDFHPSRGPIDLGDLVLSSALDWTVKLWKIRAPSQVGSAIPNSTEEAIQPIMEFAREDVVYDAKWSPLKPGVFALVDGAGSVEVWDLSVETEVPVAKAAAGVVSGAAGAESERRGGGVGRSLNRVCWERREGRRLAVGGVAGRVSVFECGGALVGGEGGARGEEWAGVKRLVGRAERRG